MTNFLNVVVVGGSQRAQNQAPPSVSTGSAVSELHGQFFCTSLHVACTKPALTPAKMPPTRDDAKTRHWLDISDVMSELSRWILLFEARMNLLMRHDHGVDQLVGCAAATERSWSC